MVSVGGEVRQGSSRITKDYLLGIALLLLVVVLWTASNFVTQGLFVDGYHKPFLVTYLNTSTFTFYLLPFLIRYWWRVSRCTHDESLPGAEARGQYEVLAVSEHETLENPPLHRARVPYVTTDVQLSVDETTDTPQPAPLTTAETARLASIFCFFWFIANWSLNASLNYTSVASSTILSSTASFFTLIIGRIFAVETLTPAKIAAVITRISFIGVLLVSLSDNSLPKEDVPAPVDVSTSVITYAYENAILGDILAIMAAMFYALYVILLKVRIRSESRVDMQLFFGFAGACNILALIPVGLILHLTGYEPFELPSTRRAWGAILVNMLITLSSDYIYVIAMLKTTPVVATVGLGLTIPLAIVGDVILSIPTKLQAGLGALLVLGGFGLVGWEDAETVPQKSGPGESDRQSTPYDTDGG